MKGPIVTGTRDFGRSDVAALDAQARVTSQHLDEIRERREYEDAHPILSAIRYHFNGIAISAALLGAAVVPGIVKSCNTVNAMKASQLKDDVQGKREALLRGIEDLESADQNGSIATQIAAAKDSIEACGEAVSRKTIDCLKTLQMPDRDNDAL